MGIFLTMYAAMRCAKQWTDDPIEGTVLHLIFLDWEVHVFFKRVPEVQ